jgi:hypothetical protein
MTAISFGNDSVRCAYETQDLQYILFFNGTKLPSDPRRHAFFVTKDQRKVLFSDAKAIRHQRFESGTGEGVRSRYSDFSLDGKLLDVSFETAIWVEAQTGFIRFECIPLQEQAFDLQSVEWPAPIKLPSDEAGYSVLPIMQGLLIPNSDTKEIRSFLSRRMFSRESYMPWWGQVSDEIGVMAVVDTPWDAEYEYEHAPLQSTSIRVRWMGSLGKIDYRRCLSLRLFQNGDYVTFCKAYRKHLEQTRGCVTLKEKIIKNPKVGQLIGHPIIHTNCVHWHCEPESDYYHADHPAANDRVETFDTLAKRLENAKKAGIEKAYVHIDGWGKSGYDNLHPDILPPSAPAGGVEGMKDMLERIRKLGFLPALHDQYRDYYVRAQTYNENQAVVTANGKLPGGSQWPGGKASVLCAQLAPFYVTRNYNYLEENGLLPDGAYLDVFSVVDPDECSHEAHKMTRKECIEKRCECFEIIRSMKMIVSSEEPLDVFVDHLDLVHHGPYAYAMWDIVQSAPFGIPVPLFNLVYHDSIIIPWSMGFNGWGLPANEDGMLHALLNAGMPYVSMNPDRIELERVGTVTKLHATAGLSEMVSHVFLDASYSRQQTVFSCNTKVTVDFKTGEYLIEWPDKTICEGSVLKNCREVKLPVEGDLK